MINKKSIWFLTLFSLILVLSVYYITMPSELLLNTNNYTIPASVNESTILVALKLEEEEKVMKEMNELQSILTSSEASIEDKNIALDKMKILNIKRGQEEKLENKIKKNFDLESFIKIKDDQIEVIINKKEGSIELANKIMRSIQEEYQTRMYITVKFTT